MPVTLVTVAMGAAVIDELGDPMTRKHAASITNAASRMRHMLDELIDVTRLESGTFVPRLARCRVRELFDATLALFEVRAIGAGIELTAAPDGDLAVMAEREAILQVLANLVANALKFTPSGGRITLSSRRVGDAVEMLDAVDPEIHEVARGRFADGDVHGRRKTLLLRFVQGRGHLIAVHRTD